MSRPAFSAPLYAWMRQGTKEIAQGLQALPSSIRTVEEPGMMGNPTPQMVTQEVNGKTFQESLQGYADRGQGVSERQREQARQEQTERG